MKLSVKIASADDCGDAYMCAVSTGGHHSIADGGEKIDIEQEGSQRFRGKPSNNADVRQL